MMIVTDLRCHFILVAGSVEIIYDWGSRMKYEITTPIMSFLGLTFKKEVGRPSITGAASLLRIVV
jgi:hypothetical protein